jgi:ClpP class serine protease
MVQGVPMAKEEVENQEEAIEKKTYNLFTIDDQIEMFKDKLEEDDINARINEHLKKILKHYKLDEYHVVFLYDKYKSISGYHSDKIYRAVSDLGNKKDILMFIESGGGQIEPAYLISKSCKRLAKNKFAISIPRRAKSAATLISLGATELHMGLLSQLGPIDPQFNGFPALGLANAVEKIAEMTAKHPTASDMFAQYLNANVSIRDLGYFERINESATQYAIRLLSGKTLPDSKTCEDLADHFTNHYKDHGFVIDSDEATELLGASFIKTNTNEYEAGNAIYEFFSFLDFLYGIFKEKNMRFVGQLGNGLDLLDKEK